MKISGNVHQIKIKFNVTQDTRRFVYVYLIAGENCYLIDSGVAGCEKTIEGYMNHIGRELSQIKGIFLTHAHPDHIGGAAAIKRETNCKIYASQGERNWVEDIEQEYAERPIPNFHKLVQESVPVDAVVRDGEQIELEQGLAIKGISTPGHSNDDMSYLLNGNILFTGDSIPAPEDFPILVDYGKSVESLNRLYSMDGVAYCCPAWYQSCDRGKALIWMEEAQDMLQKLHEIIGAGIAENIALLEPEGLEWIRENMGWSFPCENPLFQKTVACMAAGHTD